jgi:hypothetical protein
VKAPLRRDGVGSASLVSKINNAPESWSFAKWLQEDAAFPTLFSPQWTQVSFLSEEALLASKQSATPLPSWSESTSRARL